MYGYATTMALKTFIFENIMFKHVKSYEWNLCTY